VVWLTVAVDSVRLGFFFLLLGCRPPDYYLVFPQHGGCRFTVRLTYNQAYKNHNVHNAYIRHHRRLPWNSVGRNVIIPTVSSRFVMFPWFINTSQQLCIQIHWNMTMSPMGLSQYLSHFSWNHWASQYEGFILITQNIKLSWKDMKTESCCWFQMFYCILFI